MLQQLARSWHSTNPAVDLHDLTLPGSAEIAVEVKIIETLRFSVGLDL